NAHWNQYIPIPIRMTVLTILVIRRIPQSRMHTNFYPYIAFHSVHTQCVAMAVSIPVLTEQVSSHLLGRWARPLYSLEWYVRLHFARIRIRASYPGFRVLPKPVHILHLCDIPILPHSHR